MKKKPMENLYRSAAKYYDLCCNAAHDIPFYLGWAESRGPILELACGTGRVSLPLAEAGHQVWGLDLSREMLAELEGKRTNSSDEVSRRLHISHGDMSDFDLGRKFGLIIVPFRAFQALASWDKQDDCLGCVAKHLAPEGLFIINTFRPYSHLDESWIKPEMPVKEASDPVTGLKTRTADIRKAIDVRKQVIYVDFVYYVGRADGSEERIVEPFSLAYFYEEQMRELLLEAGFEIVEEMGSYDGGPIGDGPELIFVCRPYS